MPGTHDLVARSTPESASSADPGDWRTMDMTISPRADAQEWLAQFLRGAGEIPPGAQGSPGPVQPAGLNLPKPAVVHVNLATCVPGPGDTRTYRGRLDLLGRAVPVSVIQSYLYVPWGSMAQRWPDTLSTPRHPNILPILGTGSLGCLTSSDVVTDLGDTNLQKYVRRHTNADKRRLVVQLAEALHYFHYQVSVAHGLLGPDFVHVNDFGGVALDNPVTISKYRKGAYVGLNVDVRQIMPYTAPEIVLTADNNPWSERPATREGDMYAYGMLVYLILSGREPWADAKLVDIFRYTVLGQLLPRPEDGTIDDSMWSLCTACWNQNPAERPGIGNVLAGLQSDTSLTRWIPDAVVGGDRWPGFQRLSLEAGDRYPTPTDLEVEIKGSIVNIVIPKQDMTEGAFSTVMRGYSYPRPGIVTVYALKTCRTITPREYEIWKSLSHRNILPLLGVVDRNNLGSCERTFVSPYCKNGTLTEYLESNGHDDNPLKLMTDVALGLGYLHNIEKIVHGDIKPENVLIYDSGQAVLADFGLSTYVTPSRQETVFEVRQVYTLAYGAPEVLDDTAEDPSAPGVKRSKTKMSDMFAYGVLLYQTYAGGLGRSQMERIKLMVDMYEGRFPPRPLGRKPVLCDDLWSICNRCWVKAALYRPPIATVLRELEDLGKSPERQEIVTAES